MPRVSWCADIVDFESSSPMGGQDIPQVSPMVRRVFGDTEGGYCGSAQANIRPGGKV